MNDHVINRQLFEFTCTSGETARSIRHELESSTTMLLTQIITMCIREEIPDGSSVNISRLEIDLGDIWVEDFGNREMLDEFRSLFKQQLRSVYQQGVSTSINKEDIGDFIHASPWLMLKHWLLHGDLPWWSDKSMVTDLKKVFKTFMPGGASALTQFLEENRGNAGVFLRLISLMNKQDHEEALTSPYLAQWIGHAVLGKSNETIPIDFPREWVSALETIVSKHIKLLLDDSRKHLLGEINRKNKLLQRHNLRLVIDAEFNMLLVETLAEADESPGGGTFRKESGSRVYKLSKRKLDALLFQLNLLPDAYFIKQLIEAEESILLTEPHVVYTAPAAHRHSAKVPASGERRQEVRLFAYHAPAASDEIANTPDTELFSVHQPISHTNPQLPAYTAHDLDFSSPRSELNTAGNAPPEETSHSTHLLNVNKPAEESHTEESGDHVQYPEDAAEHREVLSIDDNTPLKAPGTAGGKKVAYVFIPVNKETGIQNKPETQELIKAKDSRALLNRISGLPRTYVEFLMRYSGKTFWDNLDFKSIERKKSARISQLASELAVHPHLLKYNLLHLFVNLVFDDETITEEGRKDELSWKGKGGNKKHITHLKKIRRAQSDFALFLRHLSARDIMIYQDLLSKEMVETKREIRFLRRLLHEVKGHGLLLLHFLTQVPEEELSEFISVAELSGAKIFNDLLSGEKTDETESKYYVDNAGLCLVAGYLPGLFRRLGYIENKAFRSKTTASRAVLLVQYLVNGKSRNPEYILQLNKLLCGFHPEDLTLHQIRLTKKEKDEADGLLLALIENWKALKNTSVHGFRESFLQRKGILTDDESYWTLKVEKKGFDVLLNTIPWGFSLVKLPWMKRHLQVQW